MTPLPSLPLCCDTVQIIFRVFFLFVTPVNNICPGWFLRSLSPTLRGLRKEFVDPRTSRVLHDHNSWFQIQTVTSFSWYLPVHLIHLSSIENLTQTPSFKIDISDTLRLLPTLTYCRPKILDDNSNSHYSVFSVYRLYTLCVILIRRVNVCPLCLEQVSDKASMLGFLP